MDVFDRFTSKAYVHLMFALLLFKGVECSFSSDPVIEPMLQAIPDPFNAYGPPREEDQIFSILPPLSIMTNAPSSSPSTLASTPENEPVPELSSTSSSWNPTNGGFFPEPDSQWPDVAKPGSTSPPSISPPLTTRRHSPPIYCGPGNHQRKSESKLRSVLSIIDETHPRQPSKEDVPPSEPALLPAYNDNPPVSSDSWEGLEFDDSEEDHGTGGETPRNLDLITPQPIQPPATGAERDHYDLLDQVQAPSITLSC
jgi:hypothetical protein